jgi:hypothetical protein
MRITEKQEAYLNTLTCQRLTRDPANKQHIRNFRCVRNSGLAAQLRYYAWDQDASGSTTYYIIKDPDNKILLYFSLKCGALFDPIDREELVAKIHRYRELMELIRTRHSPATRQKYMAQLQQLEREFNMPIYKLADHLRGEVENKQQKIHYLDEDIAQELNPHISRVHRTYPAVELVHFVANDTAKTLWRKSGIKRSMGEVLFWRFISPIITGIRDSLGCQYAYLFAADSSPDQNLINYYEVRLNFHRTDTLGTSKPYYDFTCPFLCQHIEDMGDYQEFYFENFNPDPGDTLI